MMKKCTYGLSLDELITYPTGLLVLIGAEDDNDSESEDDGDEDGEGGDDEDDESDDDDENSGEDGDKKSKKKAEPDSKDRKITALEKEKQRHYDRRKQAEKDLAEANKEITRLKKDGVTDPELVTANTQLTTDLASARSENRELRIKLAFFTRDVSRWVDPEDALKLLDLTQVEIDDDASGIGMDSAVDALAKKKHLLKSSKPAPRRTGDAPSRKPGDKASKAAQEKKLLSKYPGLRR
jgi:hypothetical protein